MIFLPSKCTFFHPSDLFFSQSRHMEKRRVIYFTINNLGSSKILVSLGCIFKVKSSKESSMVRSLIVSFKVKYMMKSIKEFIRVSIIGS